MYITNTCPYPISPLLASWASQSIHYLPTLAARKAVEYPSTDETGSTALKVEKCNHRFVNSGPLNCPFSPSQLGWAGVRPCLTL